MAWFMPFTPSSIYMYAQWRAMVYVCQEHREEWKHREKNEIERAWVE